MIDQMLWQQTVLMWARWWIEHPVQSRVFQVFDLLRIGILCLTVVCFMIPTIPTFMLGAAGLLFWAIHALCFRVYAGVFVKPAFTNYLLRGRSLEDFRTTDSCPGSAYLAGLRDLGARLALRCRILG